MTGAESLFRDISLADPKIRQWYRTQASSLLDKLDADIFLELCPEEVEQTAVVMDEWLRLILRFARALDSADGQCMRDEFLIPPRRAFLRGGAEVSQARGGEQEEGRAREGDVPHPAEEKEDEDSIYFVGHSLGVQPKVTRGFVGGTLDKWAWQGVNGHFEGEDAWIPIDRRVSAQLAPIVGALESEVCAMNALTVNLHAMFTTFYRPTEKRYKILYEGQCFPSDFFVFESQARLHDLDPEKVLLPVQADPETDLVAEEEILRLLRDDRSIAVLCLGALQYYSGQLFDIERITRVCHENGVVALFDLAHAAGNVPLHLHEWQVDAACWCTYKYLNGGPGCIGAFFVHEKFHRQLYDSACRGPSAQPQAPEVRQELAAAAASAGDQGAPDFKQMFGWWSHEEKTRFEMKHRLIPPLGARSFVVSNPCIVDVSCLLGGLDAYRRTSMAALRQRSFALTGFLEYVLEVICRQAPAPAAAAASTVGGGATTGGTRPFQVITPKDPRRRGAMLTIRFRSASLCQELHSRLEGGHAVVIDFRKPCALRIAPTPLYNTFAEVARFARIMWEESVSLLSS